LASGESGEIEGRLRRFDGEGYMSDHSERKSANSRRSFIVGVSAASVVDMLFFATPPESHYSKREESFDTSILTIEGKTYAESKVCGTTKPGTR
jgi:hypothetical protein